MWGGPTHEVKFHGGQPADAGMWEEWKKTGIDLDFCRWPKRESEEFVAKKKRRKIVDI